MTGVEQAGLSRESAGDFADLFLEDKELFVEAMLLAAEEEPEYASLLSLSGGMAGEFCGPAAEVPLYNLGMTDADAEALLGELFDCYDSDPDVRALLMSSVGDDPEDRLVESLMSNLESTDGRREVAGRGVRELQARWSGLEFGQIGGWRRSAGVFGGADGGLQWLW